MQQIAAITSLNEVEKFITSVMMDFSASPSSLQGIRQSLDERGASVALPDGMTIENIQLSVDLGAELITPQESKERVILYFHGGGYCTGSSLSHRPLCARIAHQSGWKLLSVNYRLAPEHRFPGALEDAVGSYAALLARGYLPADIVFAGDSAGGGLALAALVAILGDTQQSALPMPAGAIGISPWLDLDCSSDSYQQYGHIDQLASAPALKGMGRAYLGDASGKNPLASPFYATALRGMCPLLLQVGSVETLRDEVTAFAHSAERDGVNVDLQVWENMIHVWHSFEGILPEAELAVTAIADWLEQV